MKTVLWTKPDDVKYRGILKVMVLPPRNLYLPILPIRIPGGNILVFYIFNKRANLDERLIFCVCVHCAKDMRDNNIVETITHYKCLHSDKDRYDMIKYGNKFF